MDRGQGFAVATDVERHLKNRGRVRGSILARATDVERRLKNRGRVQSRADPAKTGQNQEPWLGFGYLEIASEQHPRDEIVGVNRRSLPKRIVQGDLDLFRPKNLRALRVIRSLPAGLQVAERMLEQRQRQTGGGD